MSRQLTPCRPPARYAGSRRHTKLAPRAVGHKPPPLAVILGAAFSRKPLTNVSRETLAPATRPPHSQPSTFHSPTDSPPTSPRPLATVHSSPADNRQLPAIASPPALASRARNTPPHSQPSTLHSPIDSPPASPANPEPTFRVLRTRPRSPHLRPLSGARRQPQPCCRCPPAAIRHPPPTLCQAPAVVRSPSAASHSSAGPPAAKRQTQPYRPTSCHPPPQPRRPTTHSRTNHQLPPPFTPPRAVSTRARKVPSG